MQTNFVEINKSITINSFFLIIMVKIKINYYFIFLKKKLFKEFIWNNFLHSLIAKIFIFVLTGPSQTLKYAVNIIIIVIIYH